VIDAIQAKLKWAGKWLSGLHVDRNKCKSSIASRYAAKDISVEVERPAAEANRTLGYLM
jgi:hypothetical protein